MAEDQLRTAIDAIRSHLQAELETQLGALGAQHEQAIQQARRDADAAAEQRWASTIETTRAEADARLRAEVAAAREEVERTMLAEAMRARAEAERAAADSVANVRRELEQALTAERQRAHAELEAERQRVNLEISDTRAALALEVDRAAQPADHSHDRHLLPASAASPGLLDAMRSIDQSTTLTDALAAVVRAAAAGAPRAALFMIHGTELHEWPVDGVPLLGAPPVSIGAGDAGVLGESVERCQAMAAGTNGSAAVPAFAKLPPGRTALAVPFVLGGQPVAVLYADEGAGAAVAAASWQTTIHVLGRYASACLASQTAVRTAQAMRLISESPAAGAATGRDDDQAARRYARLLVSEIKLYNEGAVRVGRERRDLRRRLQHEIERAKRLYDDRVGDSVADRDAFFQQELAQTLADGDSSLLG